MTFAQDGPVIDIGVHALRHSNSNVVGTKHCDNIKLFAGITVSITIQFRHIL